MVLVVAGCISYLATQALPRPFTDHSGMMVTGILSSVASSAMLALFGYICKKLVWNRITQEVQEFDEVTLSSNERDRFPDNKSGDKPVLPDSAEQ